MDLAGARGPVAVPAYHASTLAARCRGTICVDLAHRRLGCSPVDQTDAMTGSHCSGAEQSFVGVLRRVSRDNAGTGFPQLPYR
jgi:hypothetical protein